MFGIRWGGVFFVVDGWLEVRKLCCVILRMLCCLNYFEVYIFLFWNMDVWNFYYGWELGCWI